MSATGLDAGAVPSDDTLAGGHSLALSLFHMPRRGISLV